MLERQGERQGTKRLFMLVLVQLLSAWGSGAAIVLELWFVVVGCTIVYLCMLPIVLAALQVDFGFSGMSWGQQFLDICIGGFPVTIFYSLLPVIYEMPVLLQGLYVFSLPAFVGAVLRMGGRRAPIAVAACCLFARGTQNYLFYRTVLHPVWAFCLSCPITVCSSRNTHGIKILSFFLAVYTPSLASQAVTL